MPINNYELAEQVIRYQLSTRGWLLYPSEGKERINVGYGGRTKEELEALLRMTRSPQRLDVEYGEDRATIYLLSHERTWRDEAHGRFLSGRLIAVEGMDGTGKTSAARALEHRLYERFGIMARYTSAISEGSTDLGSAIGGALRAKEKWSWNGPTPRGEQAAIVAARVDQWDKIILPSLVRGIWVITDRHDLSGWIYRREGQDNLELQYACGAFGIRVPADHTFVLDLPADHPRRTRGLDPKHDRLERREEGFWERARSEFIQATERNGRASLISTADMDVTEVVNEMVRTIREWLPAQGEGGLA